MDSKGYGGIGGRLYHTYLPLYENQNYNCDVPSINFVFPIILFAIILHNILCKIIHFFMKSISNSKSILLHNNGLDIQNKYADLQSRDLDDKNNEFNIFTYLFFLLIFISLVMMLCCICHIEYMNEKMKCLIFLDEDKCNAPRNQNKNLIKELNINSIISNDENLII